MTLKQEFRDAFKRHVYFPRVKIDYWTFRKLRSLKSRTVGAKGWDEFFKYITKDLNLAPTLHERVMEGTFANLKRRWMVNFADNLPYIRHGDEYTCVVPTSQQKTIGDLVVAPPIIEGEPDYRKVEAPVVARKGINVKRAPKGGAVVVGRGPSLFQHNHCEQLFESKYQGLVVASDGGLTPLLEAGVVPDYVVTVDGSPVIKKYFEHPLLKKHGSKIKWITTVTVSHEVYLAARSSGLKPYWFNPMFDDWRKNESWTQLQGLITRPSESERGVPYGNAGGNAGSCAWIFASDLLKRSPVALIGIDFGYPEGTKLENTQYYSSVMREAKGDVALIKKAYKSFYHPTFKTKAFCDFVFYSYRQAFISLQQMMPLWYQLFDGTINCTEGGTLFGVGITCMSFLEFLEKYPK